ncbi:Uncharacterized protein Rs2_04197 [Raphanus sativus]|nr:Uncharacterized protein Rs2_04197 [Raphanus sativus]
MCTFVIAQKQKIVLHVSVYASVYKWTQFGPQIVTSSSITPPASSSATQTHKFLCSSHLESQPSSAFILSRLPFFTAMSPLLLRHLSPSRRRVCRILLVTLSASSFRHRLRRFLFFIVFVACFSSSPLSCRFHLLHLDVFVIKAR